MGWLMGGADLWCMVTCEEWLRGVCELWCMLTCEMGWLMDGYGLGWILTYGGVSYGRIWFGMYDGLWCGGLFVDMIYGGCWFMRVWLIEGDELWWMLTSEGWLMDGGDLGRMMNSGLATYGRGWFMMDYDLGGWLMYGDDLLCMMTYDGATDGGYDLWWIVTCEGVPEGDVIYDGWRLRMVGSGRDVVYDGSLLMGWLRDEPDLWWIMAYDGVT